MEPQNSNKTFNTVLIVITIDLVIAMLMGLAKRTHQYDNLGLNLLTVDFYQIFIFIPLYLCLPIFGQQEIASGLLFSIPIVFFLSFMLCGVNLSR